MNCVKQINVGLGYRKSKNRFKVKMVTALGREIAGLQVGNLLSHVVEKWAHIFAEELLNILHKLVQTMFL
jgi:hypothetical protein